MYGMRVPSFSFFVLFYFSFQPCSKCIHLSSQYSVHVLSHLQPYNIHNNGWWKQIDPHGAHISQADKWQPKTWKAISRPRQEWSRAKPRWFLGVSLPKLSGPRKAMTRRWLLAPPHIHSCLRSYQPACWHRAEPQSLMTRPSKETWRGWAVFSFNCYDSCIWQRALWELKISALTGIMYVLPSVYCLSTLMSWFTLEFGQSRTVFRIRLLTCTCAESKCLRSTLILKIFSFLS